MKSNSRPQTGRGTGPAVRSLPGPRAELTIHAVAILPDVQTSRPTRHSPLSMTSPVARHLERPLAACCHCSGSDIVKGWAPNEKIAPGGGWHRPSPMPGADVDTCRRCRGRPSTQHLATSNLNCHRPARSTLCCISMAGPRRIEHHWVSLLPPPPTLALPPISSRNGHRALGGAPGQPVRSGQQVHRLAGSHAALRHASGTTSACHAKVNSVWGTWYAARAAQCAQSCRAQSYRHRASAARQRRRLRGPAAARVTRTGAAARAAPRSAPRGGTTWRTRPQSVGRRGESAGRRRRQQTAAAQQ